MRFSFWCGFKSKNYIVHQKYVRVWFLRVGSQLSLLSHTFSGAGIHCWFHLQSGGRASWFTGILISVSASQPYQLPARISPVWCPAAQWQRERWLQNPILMLEVQFPPLAGKQAAASLSCCIVIIHAFSVFTSFPAQLWKTEYTNATDQAAGLRLQRGTMEEPGNTGMTTEWAVNCSVTVCCRPCLVLRKKRVCGHSGVK